jgi:hypothetical protein
MQEQTLKERLSLYNYKKKNHRYKNHTKRATSSKTSGTSTNSPVLSKVCKEISLYLYSFLKKCKFRHFSEILVKNIFDF